MQFSTKMRYGTRALVELAIAYPDDRLSVREMAERQDISAKYLERIMAQLKTAGIVSSARGIHGGYILAMKPEKCDLNMVFEALEGSPAPVDCVDEPEGCDFTDQCVARGTWVDVKDAIVNVLEDTSLGDLGDRKKNHSHAPDYQI